MNRKFLAACAVALVGAATFAQPATAETRTLKFSVYNAENHWLVSNVFKPFAKDVGTDTNGEIKVDVYAGAVLGGAKEQLSLAETGVADIAFVIPSYTRNRFPYSEAALLPFVFDSATQANKSLMALRAKYFEPEYDTVHLLVIGATSPSALVTTKPVKTLADMKGMNLRGAGGAQTALLKEVGANVVSMPVSDAYLAFQRGALEGTIIPLASAPGYKFEEVVKYVNPINFSVTAVAIVCNKKVWDSLTDAQRAGIQKAADKASERIGSGFDEEDATGLKTLKAAGSTELTLPAADKAKLHALAKPLWTKWEETAKARGLKPDAFLADLHKEIERNAAH